MEVPATVATDDTLVLPFQCAVRPVSLRKIAAIDLTALHIVCFMLMLLFSPRAMSQAKDTLYFYNGSKVVGKILKIGLGRVNIDADGIGIVNIKNNKITSIHARSRGFRIQTVEGELWDGYLYRSNKPGTVLMYTLAETKEIRVEDITSLVYYGKSWRSRVTGKITAGYTYTKSSRIGRLTLEGSLKYNTVKTLTQLQGDLIITSDSVQVVRERTNAVLSHEHLFADLWAAVGTLRYQQNIELGLDRRWQQGLGISRRFLISRNQLASLLSGVAINQERNIEGETSNNTEAMLQGNYDLFSFVSPNMSLSVVQSAYLSLTESERVRLDGDINLFYELITDFSLTLQFYYNFDSRSPATGSPNADYGFVAGLTYKF